MMILQGGVFLYSREAVQNRHLLRSFTEISTGYIGPVPIPVIIAALVFVAAYIVLRRTTLGRYIYAVGANERAARLSGVRPGAAEAPRFRRHRAPDRPCRAHPCLADEHRPAYRRPRL